MKYKIPDNTKILIEAIEDVKKRYNWSNFEALGETFELHRRGSNFLLGVCEIHDICEAFVIQVSEKYRELKANSLHSTNTEVKK